MNSQRVTENGPLLKSRQQRDLSPNQQDHTDDDVDQNADELNVDLLYLNNYLLEAFQAFEKGDLDTALLSYNKAVNLLEDNVGLSRRTIDKIASIRSNIAIILFYKNEYTKAAALLEETLDFVRTNHAALTEDSYRALMLRILANLCVINIVTQQYEASYEFNTEAVNIIGDT